MARLPVVNGDPGNWGTILNDFLQVEHNADGTLKAAGTLAVKANDNAVVHITGSETVAGVKTFSSSPVVPTPTSNTDAANKAYVDGVASSGAPDASTTVKGIVQLAGDLSGTATVPTISTSAVTDTKLATNAVTTAKILDSNVTTAKIADNNVTTSKIADNNITTAKIADTNVTTAKLADNAVTAAKLADDAVDTAAISDNAVTAAKLADNAVDTNAIADSAVTDAKISGVAGSKISGNIDSVARLNVLDTGSAVGARRGLNLIEGTNITMTVADNPGSERVDVTIAASGAGDPSMGGDLTGTASNAQIAANAVGATELADNAVDTNAIANDAVTTVKILNSNVTTAKIADSNVTTAKLADNAVDAAKLADNAVDTNAIADTAVTDAKINTVSGSKITGAIDSLARVNVSESGVSVGSRRGINLIEGSNVTLTLADNPGSERVDVTIASTGGAGDPAMGGDLTGTASNAQIAANAVGATELADNAVDTNAIANSAVTDAKIDTVSGSKITGNIDSVARLNVLDTGSAVGARRGLNLIEGTNITMTVADNPGSERVDVTIAASGAGDPSMGGDLTGTASNAQIAANAVGASELADNAVDTNAIADSAVTDAKISGVAGSKISGNIDSVARLNVLDTGSAVGARRGLNLIEGTNITMTVADNPGSERVDVTIAASGAGDPSMGGDLTGTASNAQIAANAVGATELADNAVDTNAIANDAVTAAKIDSALDDPVAGTAGLRTLGTGAQQAAAGNHGHAISGVTGLQAALDGKTDIATLLPVYYATEYGLVGDGTTDDTAAIHAAVAAATAAGGGVVQLPAGTIRVTGITLQSRVYIRGAGMRSTTLQLANSSNTHVIRNKVSTDVGVTDPNAQWCGVLDLEIDGNKSNQTTGHGIFFSLSPLTALTKPAADDYFDTHHLVMNVRVRNVKDTGVWSEGRSETRFINVVTYSTDQYGFRVGYDTWFQDCTASWAGLHGYFCEDASSFTMDGCKAFYCGQLNATTGYGFKFDNCHTAVITGCIAQDNRGGGYQLDNNTDGLTIISCVADSNSTVSAGTHPAFDLWESSYNTIIGTATERFNPGTQRNALRVRSNSGYNYIRVGFVSMNGGVLGNAIASTVDDPTNEIRVNGSLSESLEQVTYAATITPDPISGSVKTVTLTGNITVNAPTGTNFAHGTRMTFVFTQDATGGRTVTWNAAYKTNWLPNTAANKVNAVSFTYDGTSWQEVSSSTNVTADLILPSQTGNSGEFLTTNGSTASWAAVPTAETVTVLVASNDMPASIKAMADFTCDGTADEVQINAAIDLAAALNARSGPVGATQQGRVELTGGQFTVSGSILMRTGVTLSGQGPLTEVRASSLTVSTGSGTDPAIIKAFDVNTHLTHVTNMWINGNGASGGGTSHGIFYESASSGDSHSDYPDTNPDPDVMITNLFISNFGNGTRHGIYINADMRGTMISNIQMRSFSGDAIYFNASADSHINMVHIGTVTGTGFRIAGGNVKLTNCKAYYCDTYGFNITSGRGILSGCESQDNAVGFNLATGNITCAGLVADTSSTDNIIIASNRITISGFTSLNRGGGRYATTTNGITFSGTPTDCCITGVVHATSITNTTSGTLSGARNFIRIPDGTTLHSQG